MITRQLGTTGPQVSAVGLIEAAAPPGAAAGARYDERQMAMLDSERSRPAEG
jgi:hypothetical protein